MLLPERNLCIAETQRPEEGAHLLDPNSINTVDEARLKAVLCKGSKPAAVFVRLIAARNERPFTCREDCMARVASLGQTKIAALLSVAPLPAGSYPGIGGRQGNLPLLCGEQPCLVLSVRPTCC